MKKTETNNRPSSRSQTAINQVNSEEHAGEQALRTARLLGIRIKGVDSSTGRPRHHKGNKIRRKTTRNF